MKIGNVEIKNGVFLAPMAGVTDRAFRFMCKKYGVGGQTNEMVSAKAICYNDKKTAKIAQIYDDDRPCGLQLFGSEPDILAKAAYMVLCQFKPDFIDINMGCPAPKIVNNNEGSALMKNVLLCEKIVKSVKRETGTKLPLTVKMRSGFDSHSINAPDVAIACESGGADAIFLHARTRQQMYLSPVDHSIIGIVKQKVKIPVIGNGDIMCGQDAKRVVEQTGCDGVMVGRAALGNPYVFDEINCYLENRQYIPPTPKQKRDDIKEHIKLMVEDKGEFVAIREARKHVAWYIKGMTGAATLRNEVNLAEKYEDILEIVDRAFNL